MDWITNPEIWIALVTLTVLEVVLGIDNVVFISIMAAKLPTSQQKRARQIGLALAMVTRILLLLSISWIIRRVGHEVVLWTDASGSARYAGPSKRFCSSMDNAIMTALSVDMP